MFLREGRPTLDSGMCFICELTPDDGYIDTLYNFEPDFITTLIGRKFVCLNCVDTMAKAAGYEFAEDMFAERDELIDRVAELEGIMDDISARIR